MKPLQSRVSLFPILLAALAPTAHASRQVPVTGFAVTDLGTLGGSTSAAYAINNRDQVVGAAETADGSCHAFIWSSGQMQDLGTLGGSDSTAFGINDAAQIVGQADRAGEYAPSHAFIWDKSGGMHDLQAPDEAEGTAYAINNPGAVVGTVLTGEGPNFKPLFFRGGHDIWGWEDSAATAVNDSGQAAGWDEVGGVDGPLADVWQPSKDSPVRLFPINPHHRYGVQGYSYGINDAAFVVGEVDRGEQQNGFVWYHGELQELGTLPGFHDSRSRHINKQGQIVGEAFNPKGYDDQFQPIEIRRAVLWDRGWTLDLNRLVPPGSGWVLESATSINNNGQIVGVGRHRGTRRAFLLTPR